MSMNGRIIKIHHFHWPVRKMKMIFVKQIKLYKNTYMKFGVICYISRHKLPLPAVVLMKNSVYLGVIYAPIGLNVYINILN